MKKDFNKNLIMSEEEQQQQFQSSNICWICKKLIEDDDKNVRDHCHITRNFRGAAHWSCSTNLQLNKNVIFHNLRSYDSHLIFCELNRFDVKIDVTTSLAVHPKLQNQLNLLFYSFYAIFIASSSKRGASGYTFELVCFSYHLYKISLITRYFPWRRFL